MLINRRFALVMMPWSLNHFQVDHFEFPPTSSQPALVPEDTVVDWICRFTPLDFREAVRETGCFLYRGASEEELLHTVQQPDPDLLLPETYGNDPAALAYFECLEARLRREPSNVVTKPSTGHIATTDPKEAGKWGPVVSVWPLGTQWSFAWPEDREIFYDDNILSVKKGSCRDDNLIVDTGLVRSMQQPREILFTSSGLDLIKMSAYLGISKEQDGNLRRKLQKQNFGLR